MIFVFHLENFENYLKKIIIIVLIQDSDGNTLLHIAISNGANECIDAMTPYFPFNWELRNKDGFNITHLAVVKNNLRYILLCIFKFRYSDCFFKIRTIKHIMEEPNMCSDLLELMPNSKSTVLHYACVNKNYQVNIYFNQS